MIVGDGYDLLGRNRTPHADFHGLPFLLQKFLQQKRGAQLGMDHAQKLKSDAVVSAEIDWQSGGPGAADQAHGSVAPLGVGNLSGGHLPVRDFTRGKHREHASLLQPGQGFAQSFAIRFHRAVGLKGIDEDAVLPQFGNVAQQEIGQYLHIGTHAREQHRKNRAIEHAVGMIRDDQSRTRGRNTSRDPPDQACRLMRISESRFSRRNPSEDCSRRRYRFLHLSDRSELPR